jgi:hypothetical protein
MSIYALSRKRNQDGSLLLCVITSATLFCTVDVPFVDIECRIKKLLVFLILFPGFRRICRNICFIMKSGALAKDLPQSLRIGRMFLWLCKSVPNHAFPAATDKPNYSSNSIPWSLCIDSSRVVSLQQTRLSSTNNIVTCIAGHRHNKHLLE